VRQPSGAFGWNCERRKYAVKSSFLLSLLESAPEVSARLKEPTAADRKFENMVKSVQDAAVPLY